MHYALMQNVPTSTNMNVCKHFIKCAIPYYITHFIRGTIYPSL